MAKIRHLKNRHDVIFFCRGWFDLDKISLTGAEWHVNCGDMAEMETRCRMLIWRTFGRIQWHVIPEPPATLQGAATWRIQWHVISEPRVTLQGRRTATWWIHCHDPRATCHIAGCSHTAKAMSWSCHIAGCKNSIRHIENRFCYILFYFVFNAVLALTSGGFRIVSDTLVSLESVPTCYRQTDRHVAYS